MKKALRVIGRQLLPPSARRTLVRWMCWPPVGWVRFGTLRRVRPISTQWGSERGQPIDRYYIERFLEREAASIRGHVLEIGTDVYTRRFGGDRVHRGEVLHVAENRPPVTLLGDLTCADHIASNVFDCVILTQTLQFIYDVPAALRTVYRILKPGGVVLITVPGISKISRYDMDRWGYYWSFTTRSLCRMVEALFPAPNIEVDAHGNVLAAIAFLHGLASEELHPQELTAADPDYEVLITLKATKPEL